jgi:spermidine synthase
VFSGVAYFEMEEQNWSWIVGGNFITTDVATQMIKKLDRLSFKPKFIDETAITRATLLPISIRKNL